MSYLSFTAPERRALVVLLAVFVIGCGLNLLKRWRPSALPGYSLSVLPAPADSSEPALSAPALKLNAGIDPNTAPPEDLELLPGIGPSLAMRIVQARQEAPFAQPSDLRRVAGIGQRTLEKLTPYLRFP